MVEYLPKEYNQLLSALLMLQKLFQGILVFLCCKVYVEECNVWFPDHVTLILGLVVSTNYIGGATGILMGGYLYDLLSFTEPYLIASLICGVCLLFSFFVLPPTSDPLYRKAKVEGNDDQVDHDNAQSATVEETTEISAVTKEKGLTWLVVFPLVAHGLCAISEGFISAITTPYLQDEFGMEISQGSSYVFVMYIAFIIGSTVAGYTLQMGWVSPFKTMGTGSAFTMIGLLLMFPGRGSKEVYDLVPELAYLGNVLIGIGNQFISIAALEALEVTHVTIARREYTGKSKSLAESLWILGWWISVYVGHLLTLMVMKYMTFTAGGWVVAGCSGLSVCVCAVFEVWTMRSSRSLVVTPVEPSPSLAVTPVEPSPSLIISNQTVL